MLQQRVLFLCTHNAARSQLAEGRLRHCGGDRFAAFSAGATTTHVRPLAIQALAALGIDIAEQQSKTRERYLGELFDVVITVCDAADEACPALPGVGRRHWSFDDPSQATGGEEKQLAVYRRVWDEIQARIERGLLAAPMSPPS